MPLERDELRRKLREHRIAARGLREVDGQEADLRTRPLVDAGAEADREQLGAETGPEERDAGVDRLADQSLLVALAMSSLMATGTQASVISRNIAGVGQDGYSRKNALVATLPGNGVYVAGIQRAGSAGLFYNVLKASSTTAKQDAIYNGLQKIAATTIDDPQLDQSPAAQLAKLKSALQQYATAPDNTTFAQAAVNAAKGVAASLNDATKTVQSVRADADTEMATSVTTINQLLAQFQDGQYLDRQGNDRRQRCHRLSRSARQHPVEALAGGRDNRRHAGQ